MHVAVVEDDEMISDVLQTILLRHGFSVYPVTNAFTALRSLPLQDIGLYICDVHLPDGSGVDLCREFLQINPDCKVILMSGATDPVEAGDLRLKGGLEIPILQKPFLLSVLLEVVFNLCGKPESWQGTQVS